MSNHERGPVIGVNRGAGVGVVLEVDPKPRAWPVPVSDDTPFRIAILADLSGAKADRPALRDRRPAMVDRDNFEERLARFAPAWQPGPEVGGGDALVFRELDDFHADRLWERLRVFGELRGLRKLLLDPETAERTAWELLGRPGPSSPAVTAETAMASPGGSLLDAMLDASSGPSPRLGAAATPPSEPRDEIQEQIRRIISAHRLPGEDARTAAVLARVEAAATDVLRGVLHDPGFQRLEALWRSVFLLTRRIETGSDLSIWLIDITREELAADLSPGTPLESSVLHRLLVDEVSGPGATPWSLLVGDWTFGPGEAEVRLLERLAEIARRAGAPLLAGGAPELAGSPGFSQDPEPSEWRTRDDTAWRAFRASGSARFVGLALPRLLMRLPYGREGEPCEHFAFEEMDGVPEHESYLWANAAFACAVLLAESFSQASWGLRPGMHQDLTGLPYHIYRIDGEAWSKPCAESLMTERAAAKLLECGLMPLASMKDQDAVRLVRFQSVSDPPAGLAGRWNTREA